MLKRDFFSLTHLLKNVTNVNYPWLGEKRVSTLYFRWQMLSLKARHLLRAGENRAI